MEMLTVKEILAATEGTLLCGKVDAQINNISIDSRHIAVNELFIPIAGDNFDGHNFLGDVFIKKAKGFLFSQENRQLETILAKKDADFVIIKVCDTLKSLQQIAGYYRQKMKAKVIGITGSNGKTTTKEIIKALSAVKFKTFATFKNLNNHIGVPLNLLQLASTDQVAVLEMGMNAAGEIDCLANLVKPDIGIITNVSGAHLEFFNSIDDIAKAKAELITHMSENGSLILNNDDSYVNLMCDLFKGQVMTFGFSQKSDFRAENIEITDSYLKFDIVILQKERINGLKLFSLGKHNIYNALAAVAAAFSLGMSTEDIRVGFEKISFPEKRVELKQYGKVKVINDAYNANPASVKVLIDLVDDLKLKCKKILVFGEMKELGFSSKEAHAQIGKMVAASSIDILLAIGSEAIETTKAALGSGMSKQAVCFCTSKEELAQRLSSFLNEEILVVLKGSRANKLEEVEALLLSRVQMSRKINLRGVLV